MKITEFNAWLEALRSGKYKQGKTNLKNINNEYCCLGVYLEAVKALPSIIEGSHRYIFNSNGDRAISMLPTDIANNDFWDQLGGCPLLKDQYSLSNLNDGEYEISEVKIEIPRLNFSKIADHLEKYRDYYVKIKD